MKDMNQPMNRKKSTDGENRAVAALCLRLMEMDTTLSVHQNQIH
jgi:uncharacterized tellurite resistance protein B-like protein